MVIGRRQRGVDEAWIVGNEAILCEKGLLTHEEVDRKLAEFEQRWGEP